MSEYVDALRESGSLEHSTIVCYGTSLGYIVRDLSNVPVVSLATARVQRFVNVLDEDGRANVLRILGGLERTPGVIAAYVELYTGMRQGEIAGLRWRAVDLEAGDVHVCEAIAVSAEGGTYSKPPKTNQDRHVPLARGLESILKEWRASQEEQWRAGHPDWKERGLSFGDAYVVGDDTGRWRNPPLHRQGLDHDLASLRPEGNAGEERDVSRPAPHVRHGGDLEGRGHPQRVGHPRPRERRHDAQRVRRRGPARQAPHDRHARHGVLGGGRRERGEPTCAMVTAVPTRGAPQRQPRP